MPTLITDRLNHTINRSKNLRGLLDHYRKWPEDLVVKVLQSPNGQYDVTFFWPRGDQAHCKWADCYVLIYWLASRRSWSIDRVTFDAPLYDSLGHSNAAFEALRTKGIPVTRHAYH